MSDISGSKAVKGNGKRHGKAGNRRSGNRRMPSFIEGAAWL
ncbi:hypothetical protein [Bifidobacterium reuteri]|nr:hypothetical protein [Bifidobacterium reuteri]